MLHQVYGLFAVLPSPITLIFPAFVKSFSVKVIKTESRQSPQLLVTVFNIPIYPLSIRPFMPGKTNLQTPFSNIELVSQIQDLLSAYAI
jgi:hypothetical protein